MRMKRKPSNPASTGKPRKTATPTRPNASPATAPSTRVKAASEADSAVARKNLPDTCAKCHSDAGFLSRHKIPVAHPVGFLQAERSRTRSRARQGCGNLLQLPWQSRHLSRHRHAIQSQSLESAGHLRAVPQGNRPRIQRECPRGSGQGRCAGCSRLRRLPRRAPDHGPEERGLALECRECLRRRPVDVAMAIRAWLCATTCQPIACHPTPAAITASPSEKAK